ncbi:MAG: PLDc N-terminal domain-containing protein [ANME-2 cluster archaeon]|nr:PLDc N-terminal domain-containing protein [ANME-2 cluster archaeon]
MDIITQIWGLLALLAVIWVIYDVLTQNKALTTVMKAVWIIVALVFGIIGAVVYYFIGRAK